MTRNSLLPVFRFAACTSAVAAIVAATLASPAGAGLVVYTARPAFQTAAAATPDSVVFSESFEDNAPAIGQSPQAFPGFTVSSSTNFLNNEVIPSLATDGVAILSYDSGDTLTITFDLPTYAWGSDIIDLGNPGKGPNSIFAGDSNGNNITLVSNHSGPQGSNIFRGVVADVPFTSLTFTASVTGDTISLDQTEVHATPEPSTLILGLIAFGLLAFVACRRGRRAMWLSPAAVLALGLCLANSAIAVTIPTVPVGNAGNKADWTSLGAVDWPKSSRRDKTALLTARPATARLSRRTAGAAGGRRCGWSGRCSTRPTAGRRG